MKRVLRSSATFGLFAVLTVALSVPGANAQGAAEYTMGVSKAATGAAGFGNIMNRSLTKTANKVSDDLKTSIHESPALVMKENRTTLEKKAGKDAGTLHFTSDPDDAAIFIDHNLVGRTPADIKVPAGKHAVMVTRPDRDRWSKEVSVEKGETLEVSAKLVNTNPSVISLDFPPSSKK